MSFKAMVFIAVLLTCLLLQKSFSWRIDQRKGHGYWKSFGSYIYISRHRKWSYSIFQFLGVGTNVFCSRAKAPKCKLIANSTTIANNHNMYNAIRFRNPGWQHRLVHKVPFLWRFHRVHHSDQKMETTSGIRFHPVEIFFPTSINSVYAGHFM